MNTFSSTYFATKMRESRARRKNEDKTFYKKYVYTIEIDGKKYVFLNKQDVKINKIHKSKLSSECIKLY